MAKRKFSNSIAGSEERIVSLGADGWVCRNQKSRLTQVNSLNTLFLKLTSN